MIVERSMHPDWLSNTYLVAAGARRRRLPRRRGRAGRPLLEQAEADEHHASRTCCSRTTTTTTSPSWRRSRTASRTPQVLIHPDERELVDGATGDLDPGDELEIGGLTVQAAAHAGPHARHAVAARRRHRRLHRRHAVQELRRRRARARATRPTPTSSTRSWTCCSTLPPETTIRPGHTDPTTVAEELEGNAFVRVWRGLDPEGDEPCTAMGEPATLILLGDDYDGGHKAWVRWPDGTDDIVPGSQVQRA